MILWTDASVYKDDPAQGGHGAGINAAAIAVVRLIGPDSIYRPATDFEVLVARTVDTRSNHEAERLAVSEAFRIAQVQQEPVEIRCDCLNTVRGMTPPNGVELVHGYRADNKAHAVARRAARALLRERLGAT